MNEMYPSLPKTIQRAIDKFTARISFENNHITMIKSANFEYNDSYNYEEEAKLDDARENTGLFNLKTGSDFKPSDEETTSMEGKFNQYNEVHEEVYINYFLNMFNSFLIMDLFTNNR